MKKRVFSTKTGLFILCTAGSIIYLSLIFNNNLWVDEAFSACIIRGSFKQMLEGTILDTLPPFYNVFTWLLTFILGYSSVVMKFSSVIPMLLILLWLAPFHVARLYNDKTAAIFSICIFCAPHLLHYGVEIRPYSWGLFFTTAAGIYALEILSDHAIKNYVLFAVFTALSGYTHQYSLIPCAFLWLALIIYSLRISESRRQAVRFLAIGLILCVILYLPMLILSFYQLTRAGRYFSLTPLSLATFLSDLRFPYVTNITPVSLILLLAVAAVVITYVFFAHKTKRPMIPIIYISVIYLVLGFGYIVSILAGSGLFTARYLVPSLGLFWLGLSIAAADEETPFSRIMAGSFAVVLLIVFIAVYPREFQEEYASGVKRMTEYFDANLGAEDGYIIYEDKYQIELCMRYYYPSLKKYKWENADECTGKLWYFDVPEYDSRLEEASEYGYDPEFISDMSFDRYSFSLYLLNP